MEKGAGMAVTHDIVTKLAVYHISYKSRFSPCEV